MAAGLGCFPAGTLVGTEHGLKPIETVRSGERVWAYDLVEGVWQLRQVAETLTFHHEGNLVAVTVDGETITSTDRHPYWVVKGEGLPQRPIPAHAHDAPKATRPGGRWVEAGDLRVGDVLLLRSGRQAPITRLETRPGAETVYNFHVEGLHCYAVGNAGVLVHNKWAPTPLLLGTLSKAQILAANRAAGKAAEHTIA
jgi:hypothetical protein